MYFCPSPSWWTMNRLWLWWVQWCLKTQHFTGQHLKRPLLQIILFYAITKDIDRVRSMALVALKNVLSLLKVPKGWDILTLHDCLLFCWSFCFKKKLLNQVVVKLGSLIWGLSPSVGKKLSCKILHEPLQKYM